MDWPCFDTQEELDEWNRRNRTATEHEPKKDRKGRVISPAATPCDDCTARYQDKMRAAGRCRFPGKFVGPKT